MHNETHILEIRVNDEFTLNAGWWEESLWSDGVACRIIHPPEQTMYDQVFIPQGMKKKIKLVSEVRDHGYGQWILVDSEGRIW